MLEAAAPAPVRVFALAGSLRSASFNRRLVREFAALAPECVVDVYEDLATLPPLNEDTESAEFSAGPVRELHERVARAEALLIATPEYNHAPPGVLKNALDWLSRPLAGGVLGAKPVALIGATSGRWGTRLAQAGLRQVLFATDAVVLTGPALYLADAAAAFDADGHLIDTKVRTTLRAIAQALQQAVAVSRAATG